jgi:hypothetical protein
MLRATKPLMVGTEIWAPILGKRLLGSWDLVDSPQKGIELCSGLW